MIFTSQRVPPLILSFRINMMIFFKKDFPMLFVVDKDISPRQTTFRLQLQHDHGLEYKGLDAGGFNHNLAL